MSYSDNISLIGMPGAGKSTLGVVLAKKLGMRFVDTDLLLQEGSGMLLLELIEKRGIDGFLAEEDSLLRGLVCENHVIATGGSAVYSKAGMAHLKETGLVVFIDISLDTMRLRLNDDLMARGVVIHKGSSLEDLYDERYPLYRDYADLTVRTDSLSTMDAVQKLADEIGV